ncbi:aminotransferase class III-fold pyridoxal phosphate-dependent enzyme [Pendulispora albinea]|uniref:Aminotransferase class III-fold pyridoxal phosphate-dependent enzyme n=1 Tax=Pendulispora albinea TaxID=2741071 RepID=A0ABZ2M6X9_9BACT
MTSPALAVTAAALAHEAFGIDATAVPLAGERDWNFRLDVRGKPRYVLKLHAADIADSEVGLYDAVLRHLSRTDVASFTPRLAGEATAVIEGRLRHARLLDWIDGQVWAEAGPPDRARFEALGATVARLDDALAAIDDPRLDRAYRWNMLQAGALAPALAWVDPAVQPFVARAIGPLLAELLPALQALPQQAIHNDANEHNVLVAPDGSIAGIIDFGDVVRAPRICGLAVALAYAQITEIDPVVATLPVVAGYHAERPLTPDELALLPELVEIRLAMSVANAAEQRRADPNNAYLATSQPGVRRLIEQLAREPRALRELRYRDICGYRPVANERKVVAWLESAACQPAPLVRNPPLEAVRSGPAVDLAVPIGEPVHAPLDGVIHGVSPGDDKAHRELALEHRTADGTPFWLVVGPLRTETALGIAPGQPVRRGALLGAAAKAGLRIHVFTARLGRLPAPVETELWQSICPDPNLLLRLPLASLPSPAAPERTRQELARRRRTNLSSALSTSYTEPLHIVAGQGAYLVDADGRRYIDLVNNVCHVGHGHPRVVAALALQAQALNTNTRYLHPNIVEYARRLSATFPDPLSVVLLTNSGSEANDLALRLARTATRREHVLVLDWAYHGNLTSLIEISPYKFNRRGGAGPGPRVRVCEVPDPYRGRFGSDGPRYAADIAAHCAALSEAGTPPAAFIHESIPGCAGQVELAPGYLRTAYAFARSAGALCIADEVQCGFGRVGSHMWAFEEHGVVPDIVTLGKPIGNGHPIGAVVTTPAIARRFVTGMEYFNTYGGNPVSCAVGLAVLDVLRDERLMAHAAAVGAELGRGLRALAERHRLIGDVRGRGLFLGVDLVEDRATKAPATAAAKRVIEAAKRDGVLLSLDGPHDNVLKIKPPLVLGHEEARHAVAVLDRALSGS